MANYEQVLVGNAYYFCRIAHFPLVERALSVPSIKLFTLKEYNDVECFYKASHLTGTRNHRDIVDCMVGRARDTAKFFRVGKCLTRRMAKLCQKHETWIDVHTDWRRGSIGKQ